MWLDSAENDRTTLSEPGKDAICEQLRRLLASPYFSHSKRSVTFLRFVTEHTLAGDAEKIKERILGIEIFGRNADYDTASDPVVRVTASEIRKRVAQYYQEPGHKDELRITLPSGSYIPQFHWPKHVNDMNDVGLPDLELVSGEPFAQPEVHPKAPDAHAHRHVALILALTCVTAGLLSMGVILIWQAIHSSAFDFFWQPVLTGSDPVLFCVATQLQDSGISVRDPAEPGREVWMKADLKKNSLTTVPIDDLNATIKMAAILQAGGKHYTLKSEGATNLADLRSGPTIFVGAFDNEWTLRLTNSLHFHFANDPGMTRPRIVDSTNPAQPRWVVDQSAQMDTGNYRDYAIVARFTDGNTGKLAVVVAGTGRGGTLAAGEFLTDTGDLIQLERAARAAGGKKNMEVVLSTQMIDGQPGSPKMEAVYFW